MQNKESENLIVKGVNISYKKINDEDYICLTDMAKYKKTIDPRFTVYNWLRNKETLIFLSLWEMMNNNKFNRIEFDTVTKDAGTNTFMITPNQWIENLNGQGLIVKMGRYGGTYAHKDIAFEFASWLSPEFKLYLITEFQRLKKSENQNIEWNAKRELAKVNYSIHTNSIKENLIVPSLTKEQIYYTYASEADLLNVALFGITASEWRKQNKELSGNMRDYASIEQLLVLANMESYNSTLIEDGLSQKERIVKLNNMARNQIKVLHKNNNLLENK